MTTELPEYVRIGGLTTTPPSYISEKSKFYAFWLQGDQDAMQVMVDKVLNQPGNLDLEVKNDFVLLTFQRLNELRSEASGYSEMGYNSYEEASFFITLNDPGGGPESYFFTPYIYSSSGFAVCTGREVYGFPKALSEVSLDQDSFSVTTDALPVYSPETRLHPVELFSVVSDPKLPAPPENEFQGIFPPVDETGFVDEVLEDAVFYSKLVLLKQFRVAEGGPQACYQAIVQTQLKTTGIANLEILGPHRFQLKDCASDPIEKDLGIKNGDPVLMAYCADFKLGLEPGEVLQPE